MTYKLAYALYRGGNSYEGKVQIGFDLTQSFQDLLTKNPENAPKQIFIDYKGEKIHKLVVNGTQVVSGDPFHDHRIHIEVSALRP